jgi:hypothetical protein
MVAIALVTLVYARKRASCATAANAGTRSGSWMRRKASDGRDVGARSNQRLHVGDVLASTDPGMAVEPHRESAYQRVRNAESCQGCGYATCIVQDPTRDDLLECFPAAQVGLETRARVPSA